MSFFKKIGQGDTSRVKTYIKLLSKSNLLHHNVFNFMKSSKCFRFSQ